MDWQKTLQVRVLGRMRALGIAPVLPAFAGRLPRAFAAKFPRANISLSPDWRGFDPATFGSVALLEPTDPLFRELGRRFVALQTETFGGTEKKIYSCEPFTLEGPPPRSSDPAYLGAVARAVYDSMRTGDADTDQGQDQDVLWLMQSEPFLAPWWWASGGPGAIEAFLSGAPTP